MATPTWTAPSTWTDGDVPSALQMNQQIRDNFTLLKLTRDNAGKILALSSTYFSNVSGVNLSGVVLLGSANTYLGKNDFRSSRVIVPVGAGKSSGNGSVWIDGTAIKYLNDSGVTKTYVGIDNGAVAGTIGSVWVEGVYLHYIDESSHDRYCTGSSTSKHSDAAALGGSVWMETLMHWIRETGTLEYEGHGDIHADASHGDVAHADVAHTDTHSDVAHSDVSHSDVAHGDSHTDTHGDVPEREIPFRPHTDTHGDVAHVDVAHSDVAHGDSHTDTHGDVTHVDTHTDYGHQDSHTDQPS